MIWKCENFHIDVTFDISIYVYCMTVHKTKHSLEFGLYFNLILVVHVVPRYNTMLYF